MAVVLVGLALPAAAGGCLDTTVLIEGALSGYDPSPHCDSGNCPGADLVLENAADFDKLWKLLSNDPAPRVDFRRQIVVATFMGKRPNTSYTTNIDCIAQQGLSTIAAVPLTVQITDANAGIGCTVQPAVVSPFELVVFDRPTNGLGQPLRVTVSFEHTADVTHCGSDDPICRICPPGGVGGIGHVAPDGIPCCP